MTTNLTGLELREAVATRLMGDGVRHRVGVRHGRTVELTDIFSRGRVYHRGIRDHRTLHELVRCLPPYESSIAAVWQVEERITELGLEGAYGAELLQELSGKPRNTHDVQVRKCSYFALAHASPEARCRAALAAVESESP